MRKILLILPVLFVLIQIKCELRAQFNLTAYQLQETLPQANVINPGFIPLTIFPLTPAVQIKAPACKLSVPFGVGSRSTGRLREEQRILLARSRDGAPGDHPLRVYHRAGLPQLTVAPAGQAFRRCSCSGARTALSDRSAL